MKKTFQIGITLLVFAGLVLFLPVSGQCDGDHHHHHGDHHHHHGDGGSGTAPKNAFNIMMNYELGMHCTGFEFSYCCVLPPYNSILAQVVKTEKNGTRPTLLGADPTVTDGLGRPYVVRDKDLDGNGNFKKYILKYWHDAQPRNDGRGAPQSSTLISMVEGNSLLMWNTKFDAAVKDANGALVYGDYNGAHGVLQGNGSFADANDNYWNASWNHLYIYSGLEGDNPNHSSAEADKIRLGIDVVYPENTGAALHPMGPGVVGAGFDNVLTYSGDKGTVVYTQMKVLENLPVMLTSPRIWEALGLPLTPFEDSINFFGDPGRIDESTIRPYVRMKAELLNYPDETPVLDNGKPVIGFGTAPIDIPNCERCHSLGDGDSVNSPQNGRPALAAKVQDEINFWNCYYNVDTAAGDSDWYSRLKAAAVSILAIHDEEHGTSFTANFPATTIDCSTGQLSGDVSDIPQNTRLGHEAVICQRCHADNVIAAVKSATFTNELGEEELIPALTEAIHWNHKGNATDDSLGRTGSCQGCHPAHRSDGSMDGYPITELGLNAFAAGDNRDAAGGCYVGRDVHSNRNRNADTKTPSHMNAIGQWLVDNVSSETGTDKGIWCTNCHSQLSQELWRTDNMTDAINGIGDTARNKATLADVAASLGISETQAEKWLDPKTDEDALATWNLDAPYSDANVATIEVSTSPTGCGPLTPVYVDRFGVYACVSLDGDGDPSVRILDFCTTPDCVAAAQAKLDGEGNGSVAAPVPFDAATDGRDHWLSPGVPHCADCHAAPYVENSGDNNPYPPFNFPRKYAMFRYSRGHQDITCQGCHESIHGLYPTTTIDRTSYDQAASMNTDGSHGPLKCGACHKVNSAGVPTFIRNIKYQGQSIQGDFDAAVSFAHTFTDEADPRDSVCRNCHGDRRNKVSSTNDEWLEHAYKGRVARQTMDKVEISQLGHVSGDPAFEDPLKTVCVSCHHDKSHEVSCSEKEWKEHLTSGRVSEPVWEAVSRSLAGSTCGY